MSNPTEVRIHHTTLGDAISINGSWVNAADWEELAAIAKKLTDSADKLKRTHEEER